jgi:hypothetical protein
VRIYLSFGVAGSPGARAALDGRLLGHVWCVLTLLTALGPPFWKVDLLGTRVTASILAGNVTAEQGK